MIKNYFNVRKNARNSILFVEIWVFKVLFNEAIGYREGKVRLARFNQLIRTLEHASLILYSPNLYSLSS